MSEFAYGSIEEYEKHEGLASDQFKAGWRAARLTPPPCPPPSAECFDAKSKTVEAKEADRMMRV